MLIKCANCGQKIAEQYFETHKKHCSKRVTKKEENE